MTMDLRIIDFPEYPWKTLNVHKDFNYSYNISPGKKIEGDLFDSSKMKVVSYNETAVYRYWLCVTLTDLLSMYAGILMVCYGPHG